MKAFLTSFVRGFAFALGLAVIAVFFFNLSLRESTVVQPDPRVENYWRANEEQVERSEEYYTRVERLAERQEHLADRFEAVIEKWERDAALRK